MFKKIILCALIVAIIALIPAAMLVAQEMPEKPSALPIAMAGIVAALAPFIVGFLKGISKNTNVRYGMAIGLSAITGFVACYMVYKDQIVFKNLWTWMGGTVAYGQLAWSVWRQIFKNGEVKK